MNESSAFGTVVHETVVDDVQVLAGGQAAYAFLEIRQDGAIGRVLALLDQIADDVGTAAVWQIDFVAGGSGLVAEPVEADVILRGPGLQQMTRFGPMRPVEAEDQRARVSDVQIMRLPVAESVMVELADLDENRAPRDIALQDSVLVIVEVAVTHGQVHT